MPTTNTANRSHLARRTPGNLCLLFLCAGMSVGMSAPTLGADLTSTVQIDAPSTITVELPTDYLAWDLCWGQYREEACVTLADLIIEQISDPEMLYVIDIPQLSPKWTPVRAGRQKTDFKGQNINHDLLRHARLTYERDIEQAVIALINLVREARPGVRLTVNGFGPIAPKGRRAASYLDLADHMDFIIAVEFDKGSSKVGIDRRVTKKLGRRQIDSLADEGLPVLARSESDWYALGFDDSIVDDLLDVGPEGDIVWEDDDSSEHLDDSDDTSADDPANDDVPPSDPYINDNDPGVDDPDGFEAGDGGDSGGSDGGDGGEGGGAAPGNPPAGGGGGGGGGGGAPVEPETFTITLPAQMESPYGSQWGTQNQDTLLVYPAQYEAHSNTIIALPLSFPSHNAPDENPRNWNYEFRGVDPEHFVLMEERFDIVDGMMQMIHDAGYREVWFWGFSGDHVHNSETAEISMPWLHLDGWTQPMIDTWPAFSQRWRDAGMKLGLYLGAINTPNFGTTLNPEHRWITRDDYEFVGDTVKQAKDMGFEVVAFDAFVWILSMRDMPEWANWGPTSVGPRDKGIALDLISYLRNRPDLQGVEYAGESMLPYGKFVAAIPPLELVTPNAEPSPYFDSLNTLEDPEIFDRVNPGREIIKMLGGYTQWPVAEYNGLKAKCAEYNYRMCIDYRVLQQMGEIGTLQAEAQ